MPPRSAVAPWAGSPAVVAPVAHASPTAAAIDEVLPSPAEAAWREYVRAIEIDPSRPDAWYDLARLYELAGGGGISSLQCAMRSYQAFMERAGPTHPRLAAARRELTMIRRPYRLEPIDRPSEAVPETRRYAPLPDCPF
jgi:hypothetical protein